MTQESKEAEDIQSVVGQEEQTVSQQGAKTAALKGTYVLLLQAVPALGKRLQHRHKKQSRATC